MSTEMMLFIKRGYYLCKCLGFLDERII